MPRVEIQKREKLNQIKVNLPILVIESLTQYTAYTARVNDVENELKEDEVLTIVLKEMITDFITKDKDYQNTIKTSASKTTDIKG